MFKIKTFLTLALPSGVTKQYKAYINSHHISGCRRLLYLFICSESRTLTFIHLTDTFIQSVSQLLFISAQTSGATRVKCHCSGTQWWIGNSVGLNPLSHQRYHLIHCAITTTYTTDMQSEKY